MAARVIWRKNEMEMNEDEFTVCFNEIKFHEDQDRPNSIAETRRKCLALNFFGSTHFFQENEMTYYLLNHDLASYAEIVDNQTSEGVNNYSDFILASIQPIQSDNRKTWKTQLDSIKFEDLLHLPCIKERKKNCLKGDFDVDWIQGLRDSCKQIQEKEKTLIVKPVASGTQGFIKRRIPETKQRVQVNFNTENHVDIESKDEESKYKGFAFRTAREELHLQNLKKNKNNQGSSGSEGNFNSGPVKKSLGTRKGGVFNKFQPPTRPKNSNVEKVVESEPVEDEVDERLKNIDPNMIDLIKNEIMDPGTKVTWDDIAGLELAKNTIQEIVVWPMLRPDIFTGLRRPPKGILLFGPPGTGKTLIGKCIASQSCSTFFSISASSLTSKWIGDGEKMVRALFAVARCHQPAVIFIDEIDSLLSQRSETEHESSRRLKTEFLVQLDGAGTAEDDRILIIGATNRPQELDEAARRRLVKRLYIPLPDEKAREQIIHNLISKEKHALTNEDIHKISVLCKGYSGADMKNLCQEASLGPIRSIPPTEIGNINPDEVRPLSASDFRSALARIKSSVSDGDLETYVRWDNLYGCGSSVIV